MSGELRLQLTFLSDWHIGEGAGARGHIDAIIRRHPQDGLPYVPAKTLTGIWRDGCERVAFGLDSRDPSGLWHQLLREVFGSNAEDQDNAMRFAKLFVEPARFDARLRQSLSAQPALAEALVFLKPGVKLDQHGVAESQMLRFEEMALGGAELHAVCELDLTGQRRKQALALLCAGAMSVERLGANRRRGNGRCRLVLNGGPNGKALTGLLGSPPASSAGTAADAVDLQLDSAIKHDGLSWHVLRLELDLETPVVVPDKTLGNVVTTRDHIPGALLLPALDGWLRKLLRGRTTAALAAGAVQIRNAYPLADDERLVPVPAALFRLKDDDAYSVHLAEEPADQKQRKQQREGFVGVRCLPVDVKRDAAQQPQRALHRVDRIAVTHATIADQEQRPSAAVGGVFTLEAIHPKQRFAAQLLIAEHLVADLPEHWLNACPAKIRVGRAKKDDYGSVRLRCREDALDAPEASDTYLSVWLASPLILRDEGLAPVMDTKAFTEALSHAIKDALGRPDDQAEARDQAVKLTLEKAFVRGFRDDGWNNAWQMQRPSRFGLAAGSCLRYRIDRAIPADVLAQVQARGLGERCAEGYGELLFNAPLLASSEVDVAIDDNAESDEAAASNRPAAVAKTDFTRALQRRSGRLEIARRVNEHEQTFRGELCWRMGKPPNTQLGALRAQLEGLTDQAGLNRIRAWLTAVEGNANRQSKWPTDARRILRAHLDEENAIWQSLDLPAGPHELPGHDRAGLATELRLEAIRALWLTAISRQLNENNRTSRTQDQEVADGTQA